ncbi:MAG: SH3 domain-containing protein, partial [Mesorhizobium sp.]
MSFRAFLPAAALVAVAGFWLGASTPTVAQY